MPLFDDRARAAALEAADPLPTLRDRFVVPPWPGGAEPEWAYFAGNSLGLMPRSAAAAIEAELAEWGRHRGRGLVRGARALARDRRDGARLARPAGRRLGARDRRDEHADREPPPADGELLPALRRRTRILIEDGAFPSDSHAVAAQAAFHGLDPRTTVVRLRAAGGRGHAAHRGRRRGDRARGRRAGARPARCRQLPHRRAPRRPGRSPRQRMPPARSSGWDLAHAVGNVPTRLHDDGVDFAVWCNYKYVNAGPGAPGGAFVHERHPTTHAAAPGRVVGCRPRRRASAWSPTSCRGAGAEGWTVSTPPDDRLRAAPRLARAVRRGRDRRAPGAVAAPHRLSRGAARRGRGAGSPVRLVTPRDPARRGCQLSVSVPEARALAARLREEHGVVCDFREPDVLRFAPIPLYSTYEDCRRAALALAQVA